MPVVFRLAGVGLLLLSFFPSLKGVLPKDYARPHLDKQRLGELIDLIGNIGLGDKESRSKNVVDPIQLNSNFVRLFGREVTEWGRSVVDRSHRSPPLTEKKLSTYHEIFFVTWRQESSLL